MGLSRASILVAAAGFCAASAVMAGPTQPGVDQGAHAASGAPAKAPLANGGTDPGAFGQTGDQGYWFYHDPSKDQQPDEIVVPPTKKPVSAPPTTVHLKESKKPSDPCSEESTWTPTCGFITPKSFSFQSKERDALLHNMVMNPGNPDAVKAVQEYTRWMVHQSVYAAMVWKYNNIHDPKLNPQANAPISQFGLEMAKTLQKGDRGAVWKAIKRWGGFLVVFTKESCDYCHKQLYPLKSVKLDTGLDVYDASIEGKCLDSFEGQYCLPPKKSTLPARILKVKTVPSVFLYLPGNIWIRVSMGLTTTEAMEARLYNFFLAWRLAATTGKQTGKTGLNLDPDAMPQTSEGLEKLLVQPDLKKDALGRASLSTGGASNETPPTQQGQAVPSK